MMFRITLLALLICTFICHISSLATLQKLHNSPTARCLDGTPAGYYEEISSTTPHKAIIFLYGGAWCHDDNTCFQRSKTDLGSSSSWPETINTSSAGLISSDCARNPQFCSFSKFQIKYCDGASFTGSRTYTVNGKQLYSHGDYIITEVVTEIVKKIAAAAGNHPPEIILAGCSAGGLASVINTHRVGQIVLQTLPNAIFGTVPLSGFFQDVTTVDGVPVYPEYMQQVFTHAAPQLGDHPCTQFYAPQHQWRCMFTQHLLPFFSSSIFLVNSVIDSWQLPCVLTSKPVLSCGTSHGWNECAKTLSTCTPGQVQTLSRYANELISTAHLNSTLSPSHTYPPKLQQDLVGLYTLTAPLRVEHAPVAHQLGESHPHTHHHDQDMAWEAYVDSHTHRIVIQKASSSPASTLSSRYYPLSLPPHSGAFLHTCQTHCEGSSPLAFKIKVQDTLLIDAVRAWWDDLVKVSTTQTTDTSLHTAKHIHLPCQFSSVSPYQCNPTC